MYVTKDMKDAAIKLALMGGTVAFGCFYVSAPPSFLAPLTQISWLPLSLTACASGLALKFNQQRVFTTTLFLLVCQVMLLVQPSLIFTDLYKKGVIGGLVISLLITISQEDRSVSSKGVLDASLLLVSSAIFSLLMTMIMHHLVGDGYVGGALLATSVTVTLIILCKRPTNNNFTIGVTVITLSLLTAFDSVANSMVEIMLSTIFILLLIADSHSMAYYDELTGIKGRRGLTMDASNLSGTYTVAMADIDHFKKFNDTYGHDVGDQVLKMVAQKFNAVKGNGRAFRYGGEEFAILFPGKTPMQAYDYLESIRSEIENYPFRLRNEIERKDGSEDNRSAGDKPKSRVVQVTVSIGAFSSDGMVDFSQVQNRADELLYQAKERGRNRVIIQELKGEIQND